MTISDKVKADEAHHYAIANAEPDNARIKHDRVLEQVLSGMAQCSSELFKAFFENKAFRNWHRNTSFDRTYGKSA